MISLIWTLSAHTRYCLRRYMPTNRLLDAIRRRPNLRWGIPAMLLAVPYLLIASICTNALADGAPGWLHLVVLWAVWNAMKFTIMGPVSLILLVRARIAEAVARPGVRRDRDAGESLNHAAAEPLLHR
ncbi:sulfate permease [Citricoccus sp. NR2]|uniref:sulfate permease n=1 Tax=Citricoccus sp. NR2 TaxID=3004095 RepID=UPI0022DE6F39|nr:sulfate permease [Citricoccus sp. NR2]WBL19626.1 sulfate permease [Citricoccus sp. NR2]